MSSNSQNKNDKPVAFNEDTFKKLLENEATKLELKKQQLTLQQLNLNKNHDYACKALEAQKEFLKSSPREERLNNITRGTIIGLFLIIVLCFFGYCIHNGKEVIVLQIVKYTGLALVSFVGGAFYGKSKGKDKKNSNENDDGFDVAEEIK